MHKAHNRWLKRNYFLLRRLSISTVNGLRIQCARASSYRFKKMCVFNSLDGLLSHWSLRLAVLQLSLIRTCTQHTQSGDAHTCTSTCRIRFISMEMPRERNRPHGNNEYTQYNPLLFTSFAHQKHSLNSHVYNHIMHSCAHSSVLLVERGAASCVVVGLPEPQAAHATNTNCRPNR